MVATNMNTGNALPLYSVDDRLVHLLPNCN